VYFYVDMLMINVLVMGSEFSLEKHQLKARKSGYGDELFIWPLLQQKINQNIF